MGHHTTVLLIDQRPFEPTTSVYILVCVRVCEFYVQLLSCYGITPF